MKEAGLTQPRLTLVDGGRVGAATFDEHAATYDTVALSAVGRVFRDRVRNHLAPLLGPGARVLDLGCGTGLDALWCAEQGCMVTAIDESHEMVATTQARAEACSPGLVEARVGDVGRDEFGGPFDVVLSNFGVVNCVPDLGDLGLRLTNAVVPGGTIVLVAMAPLCPPELLEGAVRWLRHPSRRVPNDHLLRRRRGAAGSAAERAAAEGSAVESAAAERAAVSGYEALNLRYLTASDIVEAISPSFDLVAAQAIGTVLPTFEQRRVVDARPGVLAALSHVDRLVSGPAAKLGLGDHHIVVLKRSGA